MLIASAGVDRSSCCARRCCWSSAWSASRCSSALDARQPAVAAVPVAGCSTGARQVGSGMTMVAAFSVATCSFAVYGPLLLTSLHGIPVLTTGYIIAAELIAWSILSILVANAPPRPRTADHRRRRADDRRRHRRLRLCGAGRLDPADPRLRRAAGRRLRHRLAVRDPHHRRGSRRDAEQTIASSAVPTMQRIGYAVGAALCRHRRQCQRLFGRA